MVDLFYEYVLYSYGIPIAMYLAICMLLWLMGYRARWYIVDTIIGLSRIPLKENSNKKTIEKFFYVPAADENGSRAFPKNMYWGTKLLCFFYTSAILGLFLTIIFQKCVLSYTVIYIDQKCPFDADCFYKRTGPYTCNKDEKANLSGIYNGTLSCFGWVIQDQDAETFINAIGITGGLLGIVSSIVPIIYFISTSIKWRRDQNHSNMDWNNGRSDRWSKVFVIITVLLPILPVGTLVFIGIYTIPIAPTMTTILCFIILFLMASTAWIWAACAVFQCSCDSNLCTCCENIRALFCCCSIKPVGLV